MANKKTHKRLWSGKSRGGSLGNHIFFLLISFFGLPPAYTLLIFVSLYFTLANKKQRKIIKQFRINVGLKTGWHYIYLHYFNFGISLIDKLAFLLMKKSPFHFTNIGEDIIISALAKKKGVILLSAHLGTPELAGNVLYDNITVPINLVMLDRESKQIKDVFADALKSKRIKIIDLADDGLTMMINVRNALSKNEIVCFLGDRSMDENNSNKISFFNKPTFFPTGFFSIATITGAPIVNTYTIRKGLKKYEAKVWASFDFGDRKRKERESWIAESLKKYVSTMETVVKKHPYQWYNYYDFWNELSNDSH